MVMRSLVGEILTNCRNEALSPEESFAATRDRLAAGASSRPGDDGGGRPGGGGVVQGGPRTTTVVGRQRRKSTPLSFTVGRRRKSSVVSPNGSGSSAGSSIDFRHAMMASFRDEIVATAASLEAAQKNGASAGAAPLHRPGKKRVRNNRDRNSISISDLQADPETESFRLFDKSSLEGKQLLEDGTNGNSNTCADDSDDDDYDDDDDSYNLEYRYHAPASVGDPDDIADDIAALDASESDRSVPTFFQDMLKSLSDLKAEESSTVASSLAGGAADDAAAASSLAGAEQQQTQQLSPADRARDLCDRASSAADAARWSDAASLYNAALSVQRRVHGKNHTVTARTLNDLGVVLMHAGEPFGAMTALQESVGIRQRRLGPGHPDVVETMNNLWVLFDRINAEERRGGRDRGHNSENGDDEPESDDPYSDTNAAAGPGRKDLKSAKSCSTIIVSPPAGEEEDDDDEGDDDDDEGCGAPKMERASTWNGKPGLRSSSSVRSSPSTSQLQSAAVADEGTEST